MAIKIEDVSLAEQFNGEGTIEVRGPDGTYLGYFTPLRLKDIPLGISEEELRRREQSPGPWHTAAEVEEMLRDLQCSQ